MTLFTLGFLLTVALALCGLVFKKNGELSGTGNHIRCGSFRDPHGKLIRTHLLQKKLEPDLRPTFVKLILICGVPTLCCIAVLFFNLAPLYANLVVALQFLLVVVIAVATVQGRVGSWRAFGYIAVGSIITASLLGFLAYELGFSLTQSETGASIFFHIVNITTMIGALMGAVLVAAFIPCQRLYARLFEDGHVNTIQVSVASRACAIYDRLEDSSWQPPADRVTDYPTEGNLRGYRQNLLDENDSLKL